MPSTDNYSAWKGGPSTFQSHEHTVATPCIASRLLLKRKMALAVKGVCLLIPTSSLCEKCRLQGVMYLVVMSILSAYLAAHLYLKVNHPRVDLTLALLLS